MTETAPDDDKAFIGFQCSVALVEALKAAARADDRSVSGILRQCLSKDMRARGFLSEG
jgi:hypothetical protein